MKMYGGEKSEKEDKDALYQINPGMQAGLDPRLEEQQQQAKKSDPLQQEVQEVVEQQQKEPAEGDQQAKTEGEEKKDADPEYDPEEVSVPNLFGIKLRVLMHPGFAHQGKHIAKYGGNDAFILFYWAVCKHDKLTDSHQIRAFRNAVLQRSTPDRRQKAAEWLAQADPAEYSAKDIIGYLTGRNEKLESVWQKNAVDRGTEVEQEEAVEGDYKDWGRVNAQHQGYFPLVDFMQGDTAVSLKTVDPKNPKAVEQLKAHIQEMARRAPMKDDKELKLVLDLRIQPGKQPDLSELMALAAELNVDVRVKGQNS